jgi:hypothetical protein
MMEDIALTKPAYFGNDNIKVSALERKKTMRTRRFKSSVSVDLDARGGVNLFRYLKSLNLSRETNLLFLPSSHHYFYDEDDLKNVRLIVNLRRLNLIKDPNKFLLNLSRILPVDINFIGCFSESSNVNWDGFLSGFSSMVNNFLDLKTDNKMDRKDVSDLLQKFGFEVLNMTEINGLTYFYSRMVKDPL